MQERGFSRRTFARAIAAGAAVATFPRLVLSAETKRLIRLSANENPYGPSSAAMQAMTEALSHDASRYPDESADALANELAAFHNVSPDQILIGAGSSDILRLVATCYAPSKKKLIMADPAFEALGLYAARNGADITRVPLDARYAHDLDKMRDGDLVYICNPNNPTATITPKERIRAFLDAVAPSTIVLVDEAYHHYVNSAAYESVIPLIASHPNLIVARTFSKVYAMAGLRCGYGIARKDVIATLSAAQQWDAVNVVAIAGARASLADTKHVAAARKRNDDTKSWLVAKMKSLGFDVLPSEANFVMVDVGRDVKPLLNGIRERGVRVGRLFPAMPKYMRVTIGRPEEMEAFVSAFTAAL